NFTYYASPYYDLNSIEVEPGDTTGDRPYHLLTTLTRDTTTGNITTRNLQWHEASNNSDPSRYVETISYAASGGRFPNTITNAKNQNESRGYDDRTGQLTSRQGVDNVATSWQYDG